MKRPISLVSLAFSAVSLLASVDQVEAQSTGRPCRAGLKGDYVVWSKTTDTSGRGEFSLPSGRAAVLPNFTWVVTGSPQNVEIGEDEPFSGGNSMKGYYGQADDANNLNVRIQANDVAPGRPIPHSAVVTVTFDAAAPGSGWGFSVIDIDVDQVRISATDSRGQPVSAALIAQWFVQKFDANPPKDGVNIPSWDANSSAVVGSSSRSTRYRQTVEGGLTDTEAASAWFQPTTAIRQLVFEYESLQGEATPSFHILVASCATTFVAPTPTPAGSNDSDGDGITDNQEGDGDPDNDDRPNYLDKDSDGDTIPDSVEGDDDEDGDGIPDFLDGDSDGDNVPDIIERDPNNETSDPSGEDSNRDGIDDGQNDETNKTPTDDDGDGTPDYQDSDSDNDGKTDGDEAYDLDGDGEPDVVPSGEDSNDNGVDDAFEDFDSPEDLNPAFVGEVSQAPCKGVRVRVQKSAVSAKLDALANRIPQFAQRLRSCGGTFPASLVSQGAAVTESFRSKMSSAYRNKELQCPRSVCAVRQRRTNKAELSALAQVIFQYAKQSKVNAVRQCGEPPRSSVPDTRPTTEVYLQELQAAIADLPSKVSRCR